MLRSGRYGKYRDKIYPITILRNEGIVYVMSDDLGDFLNGFEKNTSYSEETRSRYHKYYKRVSIDDIEWFCSIGNIGYYRGYKVGIVKETDTEYVITSGFVSANHEVFTKENGFEEIDRYLFEGKVPKSEVTDVKEVKRPISDKYKAPDNWDF